MGPLIFHGRPIQVSKLRLLHWWDKVSSSYWFVPALMMLLAAVLAFAMLWFDSYLPDEVPDAISWLYLGEIEGARVLLSTIAGSIITVTSVVFSITMLTLTQASSQFGPLVLRNFMRDTGNQIVLGTFVGTFVYSVVVLRAMGRGGETIVPHLSASLAVLLSVASICVLVYFIHHVAFSIQAPQVVAKVRSELDDAIDRMFPEELGHGGPRPSSGAHTEFPEAFEREARTIESPVSGYVQAVDVERLMEAAVEHNLRLRLLHRPGNFVIRENPLLRVWPADTLEDGQCEELAELFLIDRYSTSEQDVEFGIKQMVEIAVRALSPSINDPFTAATCVDWLGEALCRIAGRKLQSPYRYDDADELRVITDVSTYTGIVNAAFDQIREFGRQNMVVAGGLLETIADVAPRLKTEEQREPLRRQAMLIEQQCRKSLSEEDDRIRITERLQLALAALKTPPAIKPEAEGAA
jgi:uncharacterized membrane protein